MPMSNLLNVAIQASLICTKHPYDYVFHVPLGGLLFNMRVGYQRYILERMGYGSMRFNNTK